MDGLGKVNTTISGTLDENIQDTDKPKSTIKNGLGKLIKNIFSFEDDKKIPIKSYSGVR